MVRIFQWSYYKGIATTINVQRHDSLAVTVYCRRSVCSLSVLLVTIASQSYVIMTTVC